MEVLVKRAGGYCTAIVLATNSETYFTFNRQATDLKILIDLKWIKKGRSKRSGSTSHSLEGTTIMASDAVMYEPRFVLSGFQATGPVKDVEDVEYEALSMMKKVHRKSRWRKLEYQRLALGHSEIERTNLKDSTLDCFVHSEGPAWPQL